MNLEIKTSVINGASQLERFKTKFPKDEHWQQIKESMASVSREEKWTALLYNCLLTETRTVFMLSRRYWSELAGKAFGTAAISGSDFGKWRTSLIQKKIIIELRPPVEKPGKHRSGLYEIGHKGIQSLVRQEVGRKVLRQAKSIAMDFFDKWEKATTNPTTMNPTTTIHNTTEQNRTLSNIDITEPTAFYLLKTKAYDQYGNEIPDIEDAPTSPSHTDRLSRLYGEEPHTSATNPTGLGVILPLPNSVSPSPRCSICFGRCTCNLVPSLDKKR